MLASLDHMIEQVRGGRGQVVLIAGEAAVGKPRLLAEPNARAERVSIRTVVGHCFENDGARQTLTLSTVAGRRFDLALLQEIVGMNEPELHQVIKELVAAQLVVEESPDRFAFRHVLTREAVYSTLLRRERQKYHSLIAETLERLSAQSLQAHLADLAYHFYEGAMWEKARQYSQHAGEQASRLYAPREAITHFTRALNAAHQLAAAIPPELYRARGHGYEIIGEFERAHADCEQALQVAHSAQNSVAEWQSLIDLGFLWTSKDYAQAGEYFRRALALARTLGDPKLRAQSLNRLGIGC